MKRVILSILVALTGVCAYAQKGQLAGGLNMNITPCLESGVDLTNFGLAAKLQYGFSNSFRGELQVGYDFESKGTSLFNVSGNFHCLISVSERFKVYPILGAGYASVIADFGGFGHVMKVNSSLMQALERSMISPTAYRQALK